MNKTELLKHLTDIEWDDFEVKEAHSELPKNIWETVSAFANASGGWVVLGVSQQGKKFELCGVEKPEKLEQDFTTLKLAENAGYGFNKMLKWEKETQKKVNFENSIDFSFVTFYLPQTTESDEGGQISFKQQETLENVVTSPARDTKKTRQKTLKETLKKSHWYRK